MPGDIRETYHAAVQHDLAEVGDATLVGVVRRPTGWFRATVDENHPELGPPEGLLEDVKDAAADLERAGHGDVAAHNGAWEEVDFARRYREYLESSPAARSTATGLVDRVRGGESVALVCFEGDDKRCHRRLLREDLAARLPDD